MEMMIVILIVAVALFCTIRSFVKNLKEIIVAGAGVHADRQVLNAKSGKGKKYEKGSSHNQQKSTENI
ncbi:MAG: hypothetical protein HN366_24290 [Deltaproteobacteria bacterium]|jgi:competence protein ComGC|nr:hypothetical protein [Deltaproteobacteria bacterium]MBT6505025.1 hypothetical protein [Deltaproteobacteria bacterium]